MWCQGWSEPDAGSDLAGIQSRAVRDEAAGGWRLYGQKTWTTRGAFCTHLFGLFRTDPDAERHRGLTYFLVDLTRPGVTVRGFARLDGDEGFAEVFFDDVFVPDADVLGDVNEGWEVAMATTGSERGPDAAQPRPLPRRPSTGSRPRRGEPRRGGDPTLRGDGRRRWMRRQAYQLATVLDRHRVCARAHARAPESSLNKLFWSEMDVRLHEPALRPARPATPSLDGDPGRRATSSRCRARSTRGPTRSSATSSPSACSGCPGSDQPCGSR